MLKEKYVKYIKKNFKGKSKQLLLNHLELFYSNQIVNKNKLSIGDNVFLKKGTFIHGIGNDLEKLKWIKENGFIASEFNGNNKPKKYFNNVGFWNIQNDIFLKDYINLYSGITIKYSMDNGINKKNTKLISHDKILESINEANINENVWSWSAEQTKEIRFMPNLTNDKKQIACILNMDSEYANELKKCDIFNKNYKKDVLKYFICEAALDKFIEEEPDDFTTNRESGIMFGLPSNLIEGILVGRKYEQNKQILKNIKEIFPQTYICNLDGKVIM